jgi:hypothetical protein
VENLYAAIVVEKEGGLVITLMDLLPLNLFVLLAAAQDMIVVKAQIEKQQMVCVKQIMGTSR